MRFDDLELLRSIYQEEETPTGALFEGLSLIRAVARGAVLDHPNDYRAFANELLLARQAGYLDFDERIWPDTPGAHARLEAHQWLQQIGNIHLTLAGRDRALGRVIVRPLPDSDEDDGRPVAGMTLEEIARAIGDSYTTNQLPKFLGDSGIPPEYIPVNQGGGKVDYVLGVLEGLDQVGSASRRALRAFIGAWLDNRLHTWPEDEVRRRILRQLGQQGWSVRDGRLVVGPQQAAIPEPVPPGGREDRFARFHPIVREVSQRFLEAHLDVAVFESFKAVNKRVKAMTGLEADGSDLMAKAFADKDAPLQLGDASETGRNIQSGYRFIFMGAVRGIRNPDSHELFVPLNEDEALEQLGLASLLMRRLDDLEERRGGRSTAE
jgi:uncharacterized protein (TIGR02391 family)